MDRVLWFLLIFALAVALNAWLAQQRRIRTPRGLPRDPAPAPTDPRRPAGPRATRVTARIEPALRDEHAGAAAPSPLPGMVGGVDTHDRFDETVALPIDVHERLDQVLRSHRQQQRTLPVGDVAGPQVRARRASVDRVLAEATRAQQRLTDGSYGTCTECGRPVSLARLRVRPWTPLCTACALSL